MKVPRILVVYRRTTYSASVSERQDSNVMQLIDKGDPLVKTMLLAHERHTASMELVRKALEERGVQAEWRHDFSDLDPNEFDLVMTVGGDGTVLHTSHAVRNKAVFGVNSAPSTSVGFLTAATAVNVGEVLDQIITGELKPVSLSRMRVAVNGTVVTERALNDVLFCHDCPASTTRYQLVYNGVAEDQLSSGIRVSTPAGSTAAIRAAGGRVLPVRSRKLQFVVREPFPAGGAEHRHLPRMTKGELPAGEVLEIRSKIHTGHLYVDGPHVVIPVGFGDVVSFSRSETPLNLFGFRVDNRGNGKLAGSA